MASVGGAHPAVAGYSETRGGRVARSARTTAQGVGLLSTTSLGGAQPEAAARTANASPRSPGEGDCIQHGQGADEGVLRHSGHAARRRARRGEHCGSGRESYRCQALHSTSCGDGACRRLGGRGATGARSRGRGNAFNLLEGVGGELRTAEATEPKRLGHVIRTDKRCDVAGYSRLSRPAFRRCAEDGRINPPQRVRRPQRGASGATGSRCRCRRRLCRLSRRCWRASVRGVVAKRVRRVSFARCRARFFLGVAVAALQECDDCRDVSKPLRSHSRLLLGHGVLSKPLKHGHIDPL